MPPQTNYVQWNPYITDTIGEWGFGRYREVVLTEGFCVFVLHMPLDDICSTYIQTLASSKTYIRGIM